MQTKFMVRTHLLLTVRRSNEMNLLKKNKNSKPECDCRSLVNNTVYLLEKNFLEDLMQKIETHWSTSSSSELNFSCYFLLPHQQKAEAHKEWQFPKYWNAFLFKRKPK